MLNAQALCTQQEIHPKVHRAICSLTQAEHINYAPHMRALLLELFDALLIEEGDTIICSALSDGLLEEIARDTGITLEYCDCAPGSLDMDPLALYDLKGKSYSALIVNIHNANTPNLERYSSMKSLIPATRSTRLPIIAYAPDALGSHFHAKPLVDLCDYALYSLRAEDGSDLCFCASHKALSSRASAPAIQELEREFQKAGSSSHAQDTLLSPQREEIFKHALKFFAHEDEFRSSIYNLLARFFEERLPAQLKPSVDAIEESWAKKSPTRLALRLHTLSWTAHKSIQEVIQNWICAEQEQKMLPPISSCLPLEAQGEESHFPNAHSIARETILMHLNEALSEESFDVVSLEQSFDRLASEIEAVITRLDANQELFYTSGKTKSDERLNAYIKYMDKENLWVSPHAFYAHKDQALKDDDDSTIL